MVHDDQKLPKNKENKHHKDEKNKNKTNNSYYYVNKDGLVVQSQVATSPVKPVLTVTTKNEKESSSKPFKKSNPLICTDLLIDMVKKDKPNSKNYQKLEFESDTGSIKTTTSSEFGSSETRSVPNNKLDNSLNSNEIGNNSLVQRDINGKCLINTNITTQEPIIDISNDHVKFVKLFSYLCCWCFPITGIIAIIFSRSARKFYDMRDMAKAKKYLVKSEWMLILTIFFGCTLIGITFGLLESFFSKDSPGQLLQRGVYHRKSFS